MIHLLPMLNRNRITIFIASNIIETKKHLKVTCWSESIRIVYYELRRTCSQDVRLSYSTLNSSNNMKYINIRFLWRVSLRFFSMCHMHFRTWTIIVFHNFISLWAISRFYLYSIPFKRCFAIYIHNPFMQVTRNIMFWPLTYIMCVKFSLCILEM